jgi:hypothetical protein
MRMKLPRVFTTPVKKSPPTTLPGIYMNGDKLVTGVVDTTVVDTNDIKYLIVQ